MNKPVPDAPLRISRVTLTTTQRDTLITEWLRSVYRVECGRTGESGETGERVPVFEPDSSADPLRTALYTAATAILDVALCPFTAAPDAAMEGRCDEPLALCADLLAVQPMPPRRALGLLLELKPLLRCRLGSPLPEDVESRIDSLHLCFAAAYVHSRDRLSEQRLAALHREQSVIRRWLDRTTASPEAAPPQESAATDSPRDAAPKPDQAHP